MSAALEFNFANFLARSVTSDTAHRAVLASGLKLPISNLALNPAISEEIWQQLAAIKNDLSLTQNLLSSPLSDTKIRTLLKDKRTGVQEAIFQKALGSISYGLAEELATSSTLSKKLAQLWLDANTVPSSLLARVEKVAGRENLPPRRILPAGPKAPSKKPPVRDLDLTDFKVSLFLSFSRIDQHQLLAEIQAPLDAKGQSAWANLLALSLEWSSSITSFVETATALAS